MRERIFFSIFFLRGDKFGGFHVFISEDALLSDL